MIKYIEIHLARFSLIFLNLKYGSVTQNDAAAGFRLKQCYFLDLKRYHFLTYNMLVALLKRDCQVVISLRPGTFRLFTVCAKKPRTPALLT